MSGKEIYIACHICCPMCDEDKCAGRYDCKEIKQFVERRKKELNEEEV